MHDDGDEEDLEEEEVEEVRARAIRMAFQSKDADVVAHSAPNCSTNEDL